MRASGVLLVACLAGLPSACQTVGEPPPPKLDPDEWKAAKAEIYRELGLRSLRGGDPDRTRRLLSEAVQFEAGDVGSLQVLARLSLTSGDLIEAKTYARWWLELQPDAVPALCLNGIIEESLGNFDESEALFRRAAETNGSDLRPVIDLHAFLLNRGREAEASALRETARDRFPDRPELLLDHGAFLESEGRWPDALETFQEACELRPLDHDLAVRIGTTALLSDQTHELSTLENNLPPHARLEDVSLGLVLAAVHLRKRNFTEALQELDLLQGRAREEPVVWLLRGEILLTQKDLAGAETAFREALLRDDRLARAHGGVARVHLSRGRLDAASRSLRRAVELEPGGDANRALLAMCLGLAGDLDAAQEHLDHVRRSGGAPRLVLEIERRVPALASDAATKDGSP